MSQNIPADCLHDIFDKLGAITFDAFPFLRTADTFIGYRLTAETVLSHARFHIRKLSAGRELDEKHTALIDKTDTMRLN